MIYRIIIKDKSSVSTISQKLMSAGTFCYGDGSFFICIKDTSLLNELSHEYGPLCEVGPSYDFSSLSPIVAKWCYEMLSKEALKNFEDSEEGQYRMNEILAYLSAIEDKYRKGEQNIGESEHPRVKTKL